MLSTLPNSSFWKFHTGIASFVSVPSATVHPIYGIKFLPLSKLLPH